MSDVTFFALWTAFSACVGAVIALIATHVTKD